MAQLRRRMAARLRARRAALVARLAATESLSETTRLASPQRERSAKAARRAWRMRARRLERRPVVVRLRQAGEPLAAEHSLVEVRCRLAPQQAGAAEGLAASAARAAALKADGPVAESPRTQAVRQEV